MDRKFPHYVTHWIACRTTFFLSSEISWNFEKRLSSIDCVTTNYTIARQHIKKKLNTASLYGNDGDVTAAGGSMCSCRWRVITTTLLLLLFNVCASFLHEGTMETKSLNIVGGEEEEVGFNCQMSLRDIHAGCEIDVCQGSRHCYHTHTNMCVRRKHEQKGHFMANISRTPPIWLLRMRMVERVVVVELS